MVWDTIAAWWGAISGTLASAVIAWNFFRDRPRVKVSVTKNMRITPNYITENTEENFILITAANTGKYPVYLSKAYFTLRASSKSLLLAGPNNLKTERLEPGLSRDFIGVQDKNDLSDLKKAIVCDAVGRKFECKIPDSWETQRKTQE
jgi:hypothetical protein